MFEGPVPGRVRRCGAAASGALAAETGQLADLTAPAISWEAKVEPKTEGWKHETSAHDEADRDQVLG